MSKVKNLGDGDFEYRGVRFYRDDSLRGYSGHYKTYHKVNCIAHTSAATRKALKDSIDNLLERNNHVQ